MNSMLADGNNGAPTEPGASDRVTGQTSTSPRPRGICVVRYFGDGAAVAGRHPSAEALRRRMRPEKTEVMDLGYSSRSHNGTTQMAFSYSIYRQNTGVPLTIHGSVVLDITVVMEQFAVRQCSPQAFMLRERDAATWI